MSKKQNLLVAVFYNTKINRANVTRTTASRTNVTRAIELEQISF
jgi:hypothetical protein